MREHRSAENPGVYGLHFRQTTRAHPMKLRLGLTSLTIFLIAVLQSAQNVPSTPAPVARSASPPLTAEQCQCSIEIVVTRHNSSEPLADAELSLTIRSGSPTA